MLNKLDALKYFCIAAETLNFRETAARLAITPPVITRVINELEKELGEQLFKRNTRNISLTAFGEAFLPKARRLVYDSEQLFQGGKKDDEMRGIVRITLPAWRHNDAVLAKLLAALEPYPELTVDWLEGMTKLDKVEDRIDIGLRIGLDPDPDFIIRTIAEVGDCLVAAPALLQKLGAPADLRDLEDRYPFAKQFNPATGRTWEMTLNQEVTLMPRHTVFRSADVYSGLQTVLSGRAVGLVSDFICRPYFARGELVALFPEIEIQKWHLFLYRPYQTTTPARVMKVFDLLTEILREQFNDGE